LRPKEEVEKGRTSVHASREPIPPPPDVAAPPDDAVRTASGLATRVLREGSGTAPPGPFDRVLLRYTGWTTDGKSLDTTERTGRPVWLDLPSALPGVAEALRMMVVGEARRLWIPEPLAYAGAPGKPSGMIVWEVEIVEIRRAPAAPPDLAAPPADAIRTDSGLAYRVLEPAAGDRPGPEASVLVELTTWSRDGRLVDSSVLKGAPISFKLDATLVGLSEALSGMAIGERRRLWLDEALTRFPGENEPQVPGGAVVDLELRDYVQKPVAPEHLLTPDPEAERTVTGLATKVVARGSGTRKPSMGNRVRVRFAGWTRRGEQFDASWDYGEPSRVVLDSTMPIGWNEALRMMVEGERRLLWIPAELAVAGRPDWPRGPLIFDVELIEILDKPAPEP
jgi:peptidylprolyl isomerase